MHVTVPTSAQGPGGTGGQLPASTHPMVPPPPPVMVDVVVVPPVPPPTPAGARVAALRAVEELCRAAGEVVEAACGLDDEGGSGEETEDGARAEEHRTHHQNAPFSITPPVPGPRTGINCVWPALTAGGALGTASA